MAPLQCVFLDKRESKDVTSVVKRCGYDIKVATTTSSAISSINDSPPDVVITRLGIDKDDHGLSLLKAVKGSFPETFCVVYSRTAVDSAATRQLCFDEGANMVTICPSSLQHTLNEVRKVQKSRLRSGGFKCVYCTMDRLSEDGLWSHCPLYHINCENMSVVCPICGEHSGRVPIQVHIHENHGPVGRGEMPHGGRPRVNIYAFALVLVRNDVDGRYLLVQEFANSGFWLPGGGVDAGERLDIAAIRECKEEAGVDIELTGVVRFEYTPCGGYVRLRIIFCGRPKDPKQLPKSIPDFESAGAVWVSPDELHSLRLRGPEPAEWIPPLEKGQVHIAPLNIMNVEGAPPGSKLSD